MNEINKETEPQTLNKKVQLWRYATKEDLENLSLRTARCSRVLNKKGYYRIGNIYAIRNIT